jgi:hypothetical protein
MYSEMATRTMESRKGTRQPHAENCSGVILERVAMITRMETKSPSVAVIWMKLV